MTQMEMWSHVKCDGTKFFFWKLKCSINMKANRYISNERHTQHSTTHAHLLPSHETFDRGTANPQSYPQPRGIPHFLILVSF